MRSLLVAVLMLSGVLAAQDVRAQRGTSKSHAIYMTAVEFKGSTTTDKVAPPPIEPRTSLAATRTRGRARPIRRLRNDGKSRATSSALRS